MKNQATQLMSLVGAMLIASMALWMTGCTYAAPSLLAQTTVEPVIYNGWNDALRLRNGYAEAIVVPEIGRVMSFRLRQGENVFWEDSSLNGGRGDWNAREWINFGGDKSWPAPESEWSQYTKRNEWRPPPAFDSMPMEARVVGTHVLLISPVDPFYGVRVVRDVSLRDNALEITTTYERIFGAPSKIGIWVITQFKNPEAVFVPVSTNSLFSKGYFVFGNDPWPQLQIWPQFIKITRDPKAAHKMGSDVGRLIWVGEKDVCQVSSPRVAGAEYPDRGASAEVYTNPNPKPYVELEMLGPLSLMKPGDRISRTTTYSLIQRTQPEPESEMSRTK